MWLRIVCELTRETAFPVNHQHHLCSLCYDLLRSSDVEFARFLHEEGYRASEHDTRHFKLFTFSGLRAPKMRRRVAGETLWLRPGPVEWLVSSPCPSFLTHFATGLLSRGGLQIGDKTLPVVQAQTLPTPSFDAGFAAFTCLTPVVCSVPSDKGGKRYLRADDPAFSDAVYRNLLHKYAALHSETFDASGAVPFALTWNANYLARAPHAGQKKVRFKEIDVIGVQAPLTLAGPPALLALAYDTGIGELNSSGFGMLETEKMA